MAGKQCCENPPTLDSSIGVGHVKEFGGLNCYITGPADSNFAVVLIADVFGYEAPNLRKLADKVAEAGFYTVVPDFLRGDPFVPENAERPISVWIKDHGPVSYNLFPLHIISQDKGFEDAKPVIKALKSNGITKIAAAGFCWGAKVVVELGKYEHIQAGVLLHPSLVTAEDIQGVKVPLSILGAEIDQMSPPELVKQFESILSAKPEINCFVKIFPGVAHGWSVRYKEEDEHSVKSAAEAHSDMLHWFTKHLK